MIPPLISVIVPVYNAAQYLPRCLDSILGQSFTGFELLLIDDGSTDVSGTICDAYAEKDSRVRVFHKENGGVSSARNWGLNEAEGDWVSFVDADDELLPNGLKVMVYGISDEVDMVMAGYEVCNDNGDKTYSIDYNVSKFLSNEQSVIEMFGPSDYWYQGYIWNKLFRMSEIGPKSLRFAEDIFFNEDRLFVTQFICASGKSVFYTTVPVYKYYEHDGSAMMSLTKGFNRKYTTDLEALARMNEMAKSLYVDEDLLELCDYEVYKSYRRIMGMMKEFRVKDDAIKSQLRSRLLSVIGLGKFVRYEVQRDKRRLMNKLKKIR